jgi:hypothetical protein
MTSSTVSEGSVLSVLTASLLKDTGYWDEVNENLTDPIWWGKNGGCSFLTFDCNALSVYDEFKPSGFSGCSFLADGFGKSSSEAYSDSCSYIRPYSSFMCEDADAANDPLNADRANFLSDYGFNSKCFDSNIMNPAVNYKYPSFTTRCLQYQCSADKNVITMTSSYLSTFSAECTVSTIG